MLCDVNEEKVKFTHGNSLSHLHYQSAFVAFCAFMYCVFIVICTYEVLNSANSYAQIYSLLALTDVLWKPLVLGLRCCQLVAFFPTPAAVCGEEPTIPVS